MLETTLKTDIFIGEYSISTRIEKTPNTTTHYSKDFSLSPIVRSIKKSTTPKWYDNHVPNISPKHAEMLREIRENGTKIFMLNGGGGTGKSKTIQQIVADSNCVPEDCVVVASTNKAADLLKEKGFTNAETLAALSGSQISKDLKEYDDLLTLQYYHEFKVLMQNKTSKFYLNLEEKFRNKKFFS